MSPVHYGKNNAACIAQTGWACQLLQPHQIYHFDGDGDNVTGGPDGFKNDNALPAAVEANKNEDEDKGYLEKREYV